MRVWWAADARERYWMETTRREDLGANLLAPKLDDTGRPNPKYVLFTEAKSGDIVFHYDADREAIVAYSRVAGSPKSTTMQWEARGTSARARARGPQTVDAWELPLDGYTALPSPVTRAEVASVRTDVFAIRDALEARYGSPLYFPFAPYRDSLRAAQSYITKMPRDLAVLLYGTAGVVEAVERAATESLDLADARISVEQVARPTTRQRRQLNPEIRLAVESHAMRVAIAHYEAAGWSVRDVSRERSYDLECSRSGEALHVEVKGTQSAGVAVLLTPNEVQHAREYPACALFILANVSIDDTTHPPRASGGEVILFDPWNIDSGRLLPVGYEFWPEG